jgi:hypothetical protein
MDKVKLILSDANNKIPIDMNKNDLVKLSPYFNNLLNFGKEKNQSEIIIEVENASIAKNIITYSSANWKYILDTLQCQNYFNMDVDINKLYDIVVPPEGFDMLLKTIDELNCTLDDKLKATIKNNIPNDYDLNNLSDEFIKELIQKKYYLVLNCGYSILVWEILNDKPSKPTKILTRNTYGLTISPNNQAIIFFDQEAKLGTGVIKSWDIYKKNVLGTLCEITNYVEWRLVLSFSPNAQIIAVVNHPDYIIKLFDVSTGKLLNTLDKHTHYINCIAISSNGQIIASGSNDNSINLWKVSNGRLLNTLTGHIDAVHSVAFSPDNLKIVSSDSYNYIKIWDVSSGKCLNTLNEAHTCGITGIVFSPDGQTFASNRWDKKIKIWDISTYKLLHTIVECDNIQCIAFSPDGEFIASTCYNNEIHIWSIKTGKLSNTLIGYAHSIHDIIFSGFIYDDVEKKLIDHLKSKSV